MTTIHTDGRALADAAVLIRKVAGRDAVARLVVSDGRAEVEAVGAAAVSVLIGHGTTDIGSPAFAADLATFRTMRNVGPVTIRDTSDGATMTYGSVAVPVGEARELKPWPRFPGVASPVVLNVRGDGADAVASTLRSVADACAGDDFRAVLTHVALTPGEAAATDTYRLNVADVPVDGEPHTYGLVPAAWVRALPRRGLTRLEVIAENPHGTVGVAEMTWDVVTGRGDARRVTRVTIIGHTTEGPFPDYRGLIPSEGDLAGAGRVTIPAGIADIVQRMSAPVTLTTGDTPDTLTVTDPSGIAATMGTATVGDVRVAVNPTFLADLAAHVGDGADLVVRDGSRAMVAEVDGRATLLMPMRMS